MFFSLSLREIPFKPFDETMHIDYRPFTILSWPFDEAGAYRNLKPFVMVTDNGMKTFLLVAMFY